MTAEQTADKAPVKAMWICMVLGWALFATPIPGTIFLAGPLNLAAFILAIVCLVRSRVGQGVVGLIGSTVISAIAYIIGLVIMGAGIAGAAAQAERDRTAAEVDAAAEVIVVNAPDLVADYEANEVAADRKYKGKILEVSGIIDSMGKDRADTPYIILAAGRRDTFRMVHCSFSGGEESELAALATGGNIAIRGKCNGLAMGNVQIGSSVIAR